MKQRPEQHTSRSASCVLLWALACAVVAAATAEDLPQGPPPFRKVYVPENRIGDWPLGGEKYLPLEPEQFSRLSNAMRAALIPLAQPRWAEHRLRYEGDGLLVGETTLEFFDEMAREKPLGFADLGRTTVVVHEARWEDDRVARLALDTKERLLAELTRTGKLKLSWSARESAGADGRVTFDLLPPRASAARATLELAAGLSPRAVIGAPWVSAEGASDRWQAVLPPEGVLRFDVGAPMSDETTNPTIRTRYEYEASPEHLRAKARFEFDATRAATLRWRIDGTLTIDAVTLEAAGSGDTAQGRARTQWRVIGAEEANEGVVLEAEISPGQGGSVIVRATAPISRDETFLLPRLRLLEHRWCGGSSTLNIMRPLALAGFESPQSLVSRREIASSSADESIAWHEAADLPASVRCEYPSPRLAGRAALTIQVARDEVRSRWSGQLEPRDAPCADWRATVGSQWLIESVQATPENLIASWEVRQDGLHRVLDVRFVRSLAQGERLRLSVEGRWLRPHAGGGTLAELEMIATDSAIARLIGVRASAGQRLRVIGDRDAPLVAQSAVSAEMRELFWNPEPSWVVADTALSSSATFDVDFDTEQTPVEIESQVVAGAVEIEVVHTFKRAAVPGESAEMVVVFPPGAASVLDWQDASGAPAVVRAVSNEEMIERGLSREMRGYRLRAGSAAGNRVAWKAIERRIPADEVELAFPWVDAAPLTARWVNLRARADWTWQTSRMERLPDAAAGTASPGETRALFRHVSEPLGQGPTLKLIRSAQPGPGWAIWDERITSAWGADGTSLHSVRWQLEHWRTPEIEVRLGRGSELLSIERDGRPLVVTPRGEGFACPLPADRAFSTLVFRLRTHDVPGTWWQLRQRPLCRADVRPLRTTWEAVVPPGNAPVHEWATESLGEHLAWLNPVGMVLGIAGRREANPAYQADLSADTDTATAIFTEALNERTSEPFTWGEWLARADRRARGAGWAIWIDPAIGFDEGVVAGQAMGVARGASAPVDDALQRANLMLVVGPRSVWLTTRARWHVAAGKDASDSAIVRSVERRFAARLRDADRGVGAALVRVERWRQMPSDPWNAAGFAGQSPWTEPLWVAEGVWQTHCVLVDRARVGAVSLALAVAAFVVALRRAFAARYSVASAIVALGIALLMPGILAEIPLGCAAGFAIAGACRWRRAETVPTGGGVPSAATALLIAVGLGLTAPARCEADPRDADFVAELLVPIDAQSLETRGAWLVPEGWYLEFKSRVEAVSRGARLPARATIYRAALVPDVPNEWRIERLRATIDRTTVDATGPLRLPFEARQSAEVPLASASGRRLATAWSEEGTLVIEGLAPGETRLELELFPRQASVALGERFVFTVPMAAQSRLELEIPPADAPPIESARGVRAAAIDARVWSADFGSSNALEFELRAPVDRRAKRAAEELWRVDAQGEGLQAMGRVRLEGVEAGGHELVLRGDGAWDVKSVQTAAGEPLEIARSSTGEFVVKLGEHAGDSLELECRLNFRHRSPLGELRSPRLEWNAGTCRRRWVALGVSEMLEFDRDANCVAVDIGAFQKAWKSAEAPIAVAYDALVSHEAAGTIRSRGAQLEVDEEVSLVVGTSACVARGVAEVKNLGGACWQHRLRLPSDAKLRRVVLFSEGAEQTARWTRDGDGTFTLFLSQPAAPVQIVRWEAEMPLADSGTQKRLAWTANTWPDAISLQARGRVLAIGDIEVATNAGSWQPFEETQRASLDVPAIANDPLRAARLIGVWSATDRESPLEMLVGPAPQAPALQTVVRLEPQGAGWLAVTQTTLPARSNRLAALVWNLRAPWQLASQRASIEVARLPGEEAITRVRWFVEPEQLAGTVAELRLTSSEPDGSRELASLVSLDCAPGGCLVLLPKRTAEGELRWDVEGMIHVEPPELIGAATAAEFEFFQPARARFGALAERLHSPRPLRATLREVQLQVSVGAFAVGRIGYLLNAASGETLRCQLPAGHHVSLIRIDGRVLRSGDWRQDGETLVVQAGTWPKHFELEFRAPFERLTALDGTFELPELMGVPVDRTLWRLVGPRPSWVSIPAIEEAVADRVRTESMARWSDEARSHAGALPASAVDEWLALPANHPMLRAEVGDTSLWFESVGGEVPLVRWPSGWRAAADRFAAVLGVFLCAALVLAAWPATVRRWGAPVLLALAAGPAWWAYGWLGLSMLAGLGLLAWLRMPSAVAVAASDG